MFKSIGTKLLVFSFLVAAIPVLLVSLISYQTNRQSLVKEISEGLRALSNEKAYNIAQIISLRQEKAKEIAGDSVVRQLKPNAPTDPRISQDIQKHVEWTYFETKLMLFGSGGEKNLVVDSIDVCDADGAVVGSSRKESNGRFLPQEYADQAKKSGSYFAGISEDPDTRRRLLTFVEGIRSQELQEFAGFVVLRMNAEILNEITTRAAGLGKTEETYLVDKNYWILSQLRKSPDQNVTLKSPPPVIAACFGKEEQAAIYKNYAGITVLGATKYLPAQDWCLVDEIESAEAFAPVSALRQRIILLSGILMAGVLALAWLTSRSLSRPVLSVRNAALEIAEGNTEVRTRVSSRDEIGDLGAAFNLMTDRLVRTQKELARSNQDLEEFSYVASHDLQEPLRKIISYGDILEEDYSEKIGSEGSKSIRTMQKAAQRMQELIQALLEYSRVTRKVDPFEPVALGPMIQEVCSDLETAIRESKGTVEVGDLPTIKADPVQMRQLFQNLIGNAMKFSRKGIPPCVTVAHASFLDGRAEIRVADNGIGFDTKFIDKIFQPFQRLVTREEYKGTGIGLSVCKKIVERHRGEIEVESKPGEGTTFIIRLPEGGTGEKG
ncbi:MAG: ATP-binding protein [Pseudomonadota bacterium]